MRMSSIFYDKIYKYIVQNKDFCNNVSTKTFNSKIIDFIWMNFDEISVECWFC